MQPAMVLAAGLGTRLRPLSDELPKPLVPVGDRPALAHVVGRLAAWGASPVVLNTHHRAEDFAGVRFDVPVRVSHEPRILGTAGGVQAARGLLGEGDVVVWNGDILAEVDLVALSRALRDARALAAWTVAPRPRGEGTVGLDTAGRVVRVRDVRAGVEVQGGDFLGVSVLSRELRDALPGEGCLVGDVLAPRIAAGGTVVAVLHPGAWDDIGTPPAYLRANLRWLRATTAASFVAPGAQVAPGVALHEAIVGAGARVEGEGGLTRVVVWPGAVVTAPLADAVVTTAGRIVTAA